MTNNSFQICPEADVLYAMDRKWWDAMAEEVQSFQGERFAGVSGGVPAKVTPAAQGGNSGAGAVYLAAHFGATRVILLGYDAKAGTDGRRHWHGSHKEGLGDAQTLPKFPAQFALVARDLAHLEVLNASRDTLLACWPRVSLEEALDRDRPTGYTSRGADLLTRRIQE